MKYEFTQPQTLNGVYYGIGDIIDDTVSILNVEVLKQNAVLIPVVEQVVEKPKVEDVKISVAEPVVAKAPAAKAKVTTKAVTK